MIHHVGRLPGPQPVRGSTGRIVDCFRFSRIANEATTIAAAYANTIVIASNLDRQNHSVRIGPRNANGIVSDRCGNASDLSAVVVQRPVGTGIIVVVVEIPSMDIVDPSVAVVVQSVAGNLARIGKDVQIRMRQVDTVVDDRNDDRVGAAILDLPCFGQIGICVFRSRKLSAVVQTPLIFKQIVIGHHGLQSKLAMEIWRRPLNSRVLIQCVGSA
ncbi:hypothetical protein Pla52n_62110 [Stieleria varia]|uniref:Uncharacterized protein n=1 Tax=Stieleria varia TaxID=2528005 RepID=A0A5C5ZZ64_9BACT|nr:hypothetical protein Pla52n_62110 [Stieleria varia]